jgi:hypothetical protein
MPTAHSLVAPTYKMSDDEPYRQSGPQGVAPHSIPPDNSFPRHVSQPPQMPSPLEAVRAVTTRPGPGAPPNSIPPQNQARGSTPPAGYSMPQGQQHRGHGPQPGTQQRQNPQQPRASSRGVTPAAGTSLAPRGRTQSPAESAAAAPSGRRWGLILIVLLIDIGLAASGAWMLSQGLAN